MDINSVKEDYTFPGYVTEDNLNAIPTVLKINGTKGDRKDTLYIGRTINMGGWRLTKSKWHNPFTVKTPGPHRDLCLSYYYHILENEELRTSLYELANHNLGCWCHPKACHGHILQHLYIRYVLHGVNK
jgi:hypothetical protein